jgi:hypothetical protein
MREDWQQKVIDEKADLDSKIERLETFLGTEPYRGLSSPEQDRLHQQRQAMRIYSDVLGRRIAAFTQPQGQ